MKLLPVSALFLALVLFGSRLTGYCENTAIVSFRSPKPVSIARGTSAELLVRIVIEDGYHIQANPVNNEFLIPASLNMASGENFVLEEPIYPVGHPITLEGSLEVLLTYEKDVVIRLPVTVKNSAMLGPENVKGELSFQPCNSRKCLFPRSIPISIPVKIIAQDQ